MPRHLNRQIYLWLPGTLTVSKEDYSIDVRSLSLIKSWLSTQGNCSVQVVCEYDEDFKTVPYLIKWFPVELGTPVDLRGIGEGSPDWARFVIWGESNLNSVQALCIVPGKVNEVISLHSKRVHIRFYGVETLESTTL